MRSSLGALALGIAAFGAIDWLHARAARMDRLQVRLAAARADIGNLNALEWSSISRRQLDDVSREQLATLSAAIRTGLGGDTGDGEIDFAAIRAANEDYLRAIAAEFEQIASGAIEAAIEQDERVVDPAFGRLSAHIDNADAECRGIAERTERLVRMATLIVLLSGSLAMATLTRRMERSRFDSLRQRAEQDALAAANTAMREEIAQRVAFEHELEVARNAAEAANCAKSRFLATMSHEIRTPINGVLGMATMLRATPLSTEQGECVQTIQACGSSLLEIVNDVLDLAKVESGRLEFELAEFDLHAALTEAVALLRPDARRKQLTLELQELDVLPRRVVGDVGRVKQIVSNLLGNAIKFTAAGSVTLRAESLGATERGHRIALEVTDTGIGIAADVQACLFQPFVQGDATTTRRFGGTGLGLSICRAFAERMHGSIGVRSEPGVGSTFRVELELGVAATATTAPANAAATAPTQIATGHLRNRRVLVAEDNPVNQKIAKRFLETLGCRVVAVANGAEAVRETERVPFDAILMDVQMPELDGLEATRRIRAAEATRGQRTPILAVTANAIAGDRERCLEAGMDDYLSKPFRIDDLARHLAALLPATPTAAVGTAVD